ncbi:MAG: hypothetical protein K9L85_01320 [Candidatus Peribacteraceae bacterium]|nr:hypothetical protein [Candidatus Peribacteraceae bacterium]
MFDESRAMLQALGELPDLKLRDGRIPQEWLDKLRKAIGEMIMARQAFGEQATLLDSLGSILKRSTTLSKKPADKLPKHIQRLDESVAAFNKLVAKVRAQLNEATGHQDEESAS